MDKLRLPDIPSGHDGKGYVTLNGRVLPAFKITKVSARFEVKKDSRQFLGEVMEQNAVRGGKGMGDLSYCHSTSALMDAVKEYKNGGTYPEITIQYHSEKPAVGRCEVVLTGVILDTIGFGSLDDSNDAAMVTDTSFTFDDFDIISKFKE